MKEEIKQVAEVVATHPKASLFMTAVFTSNVWLDYGEPLVRAITSIGGMCVVIFLAIKHFLDLKKEWKNKDND